MADALVLGANAFSTFRFRNYSVKFLNKPYFIAYIA